MLQPIHIQSNFIEHFHYLMIIEAPHELMCSDTIGTEVISTDTVPAPSYSLFLGFAAIAEDLLVLYGSNLQEIRNDVLWL